jgi:hypothetical protein
MRILKTSSLVVVVTLAMASQVSASLLTNPGFEDPLGSEWTFTVLAGDAALWACQQSSVRTHSGSSSLVMAFGPTNAVGKAYVEQVVSGLTPGVSYDIGGWINLDWQNNKVAAFMEVLGGGAAVQAPVQAPRVLNTNDVWEEWTLSQTPDASGNLTVRLYVNKYGTTAGGDKTAVAYFDDIVVTPEPASILLLLGGSLGLGALRRRR